MLFQGVKSAVMTAHKRKDPISLWLVQLKERVGWQKAMCPNGLRLTNRWPKYETHQQFVTGVHTRRY